MKKILFIILILLSVQSFAQEDNAQPPAENADKAKIAQTIDALKVAYITKELNLSAEEAQKFWPIYNGLSGEMKKARFEFKQDDIAFQERKVVIMKRYRDDFKRLFNNDDRVKKCFRAEPEFHKLLRSEWMRRHSNNTQQPHINPRGMSGTKPFAPLTTPRNNHPSAGKPRG